MSTAEEKNSPGPPSGNAGIESRRILYKGAAVLDWRGRQGTSLLVDFAPSPLPRVLAVGDEQHIASHPAAKGAKIALLPDCLILPGLINAHTHLDLTHIGPQPHAPSTGFIPWVNMIRSRRCLETELVQSSVAAGADLCLAGGTVAVGDIAGTLPGDDTFAPWRALCTSGLLGTSYQEFFAIGNRREAGERRLASLFDHLPRASASLSPATPRLGIQPHAPYTVDLRTYLQAATRAAFLGLPIATHLAETIEEQQFVSRGTGPFRQLLEKAGIWDDSVLDHIGHLLSPVLHLEPALRRARFLIAHANDVDDAAIEILSEAQASVAYCPRASEYFSAHTHFGPHRYRDMLEAGITVALGTDSIVNLPEAAADASRGGMSILDEMRLLFQRDGTDPWLLLKMATINGARALGLQDDWFEFTPGSELAGAVAVPLNATSSQTDFVRPREPQRALEATLQADASPSLLFIRNRSRLTRIPADPRGAIV